MTSHRRHVPAGFAIPRSVFGVNKCLFIVEKEFSVSYISISKMGVICDFTSFSTLFQSYQDDKNERLCAMELRLRLECISDG